MPLIPWWALLSSGFSPVLLIGGFTLAAALQPAGYDPMIQSISSLAAQGAADQWLMTTALFLLGVCNIATAFGLRTAALPGRITLGLGGLAAMLVALSPEPDGGTSIRHLTATGVGFTALALWPTLAAAGNSVTWALRPRVGYVATAVMAVGAGWFLLELHGHGAAGLAERVLTVGQAFWPLVVVTACLAARLKPAAGLHVPEAVMARSEGGGRECSDQSS
jgi:hypothetical membrane protein